MIMRRLFNFLVLILAVVCASPVFGEGARIKDIAVIAGAPWTINWSVTVWWLAWRAMVDKNPVQTVQTIANVRQRYGCTFCLNRLSPPKTCAVVMVKADIPRFQEAWNDALMSPSPQWVMRKRSRAACWFLQTPLFGADGIIYAVAQGAMTLGSVSAGGEGGGASVQKNHPTVGQISGGALVEKINSCQHRQGSPYCCSLLREPDLRPPREWLLPSM